ncbi:LamG domain-containing protein [Amycolatopsis mediterranei S699]|uniref:LamG domain-containing protein n=2 Tax=Amycolatopsis mediterranei TaxID=33910 RepID=A0A0H3D9I5_AMYMU|nr:LamG domain-containing protein [Amycolatopsis mediterranei]ADJ47281.1 LamG domain-containing protein [Amycolatopsis mediterranei U32]AEK44106.1 LamG domain-containing protein [Amycolatopsis mediterranei S699]AFO78992.1 LamG domain-containing protein [Amycolatopsis mediterranei S699]AGT86120.1 LamG domain-containing protein [Amycolatopsis mediterranei RB]KDO12530.1 laminin [Amycolatopsis mediterranei]
MVPGSAPDEVTATAYAREGGKPVEVTSETTETSQVMANPDGSWTMTQYVHPVRVKQAGAWAPVDTTLVRRADGSVGPKAVTIDVKLNRGGTGSAGAPIVQAGQDGKEIGLKWASDLPTPTLTGDTATYAEVLPGVDLTVKAIPEGFTQNLVIKTPEAAKNPKLREIPFGLHTRNTTVSVAEGEGRGTPAQAATDGLDVKDAAGKVVFSGDASRMWDSSGDGSPAERELGEGGGRREAVMDVALGGDKVTITPDQAFLADPATRYPVSLDPDSWCDSCGIQAHVVVQSGYRDAHNWNATDGDLSNLKAGFENLDRAGTSRSYIQMNSARLGGTLVHRATLNTKIQHSAKCDGDAKPTGLWLSNPASPDTTWAAQPGWSYQVSTMNTANCHDAPDVSGVFEATSAAKDAAANWWQSTWFVLAAANEGDGMAAWRRFDLNPYFAVNYDSAPNSPAALSMQNGTLPCTSGPDRPWVYTKTPQIAGRLSDPDGGTVYGKFALAYGELGHNVYIHDNADNLVPVGTGGSNQESTAQLAAVPPGWINEDGIYNWSMQATDGELWSNWVGNCEFVVDTKVPAPPVVAMTAWTDPKVQGDAVEFSVWTGMATENLYDIDHFVYTTDGSEPQTQGSPTAPATQGVDANGKMVATTSIKVVAANGNQNLIKVKSVNKAGMPSPDATCVVLAESNPALDGPSCSYHVQPLTPGKNLVAAWGADEPSGTTLIDSASSTPDNATLPTHPATVSGGVTRGVGYNHGTSWTHPDTSGYSDGVKGAISLDGTSGYAEAGDQVLDASKSFTVAAWAKLTDTTHSQTILAQDGTQAMALALQYNKETGSWALRVTAGDSATPAAAWAFSSGPAQIGVWTHVAGTYDASTHAATLYVDGAKQSTVIAQPWAATGPAVLGAAKWAGVRADFFHGSLDDLQVWQRALSGQDVHDLAGVSVPLANYGLAEGCGPELTSATSRVPSLQASWALGQTSGNTATDSTGHGNTLALTGGYSWVPGHDGGGLQVDGATGYGSTPGPVVNTVGSFTVSAWVNPTDLNSDHTVLSQAGSRTANFVLRYDKAANRWAFGMSPADNTAAAMTWATGTSAPQAGTWTLLTATFNKTASRLRLSVNGKREADATVAAAWTANGALLLGAEPGAKNPFKGVLDQGRVWSHALTDDQIAAMNSLRYFDTVTQSAGTPSDGVSLGMDTGAAGNPAACAAQFTINGGEVATTRPATLRTDKSFTFEAWVRHTWTASDASVNGPVDPSPRAVVSTTDTQFSPLLLGYRPWADASGVQHGRWSFLISPSATGNDSRIVLSDAYAADNTWTHLAATYDAATGYIALYVNGVKQNFYVNTPDGGGVVARDSSGGLVLGHGVWTGRRSDVWYGGLAGVRVFAGLRGTDRINLDKREDDPGDLFGVTH